MNRQIAVFAAAVSFAFLLWLPAPLGACASTPAFPGPPLQFTSNPFPNVNPPGAGRQQGVIGFPVDVFAPQTPMTCVCGLGLGSSRPPSLTVDQVLLTRFNAATGQHTILTEFVPLQLSSLTSQALAFGPGQLLSNPQWFGFSGQIQPFTAPALAPGEELSINFVISFSPPDAAQLDGVPLQFAAGLGEPGGFPNFTDRDHPATYSTVGELPSCVPTQNVACLNGGRFRAEIDFQTATTSGKAVVGPCPTDESATFAFFPPPPPAPPTNLELLLKVLEGCPVNNRFWVFFSATTNVEFTLTVTDTKVPGMTKSYFNPLNRPAPPVQDTEAFATCP